MTKSIRPLAALALSALLFACSGGSSEEGTTAPTSKSAASVEEPAPAPTPVQEKQAEPTPVATEDSTAAAVPEATGAPPEPTGEPTIEFERLQHDFGDIDDTEVQKTSFAFKNTGTGKLVISEVKASCGCTAAELEKTEFLPGEGDAIAVEFKPKGHGRQHKSIDVASNDPKNPRVKLVIASNITPFVAVEPYYVQFGNVQLGEPHTQTLELTCRDPEMQLIEAKAYSDLIETTVRTGAEAGKPEVHTVIDVTLGSEAPWGRFNTSLAIKVRGRTKPDTEPVEHSIHVPITASIFRQVQVDPVFFSVGAIEPGGEVDRTIRLVHVDGTSFNVTATEVRGDNMPDGLEVHAEPFAEQDGKVGIALTLKGPVGDFMGLIRGTVAVMTDVPGEDELAIEVMGLVREMQAH